ncbi:MAG: DnaD domain protein [Bacilli bacterium]|nr:DnaD domain protein [Bacilli bacterium]
MQQLKDVLMAKKLVVNEYIIRIATLNNLSLNEFLVLVYLDNDFGSGFEVERMSEVLGLDVAITMEAFNSLMIKGLVSLDSVKDEMSKLNEVVNLDAVYELMGEIISVKTEEVKKDDLFKVFEKELGRMMSSMELEIINGWLVSGTSEELILGALKEAVYNGVNNFRYIDKIIYEWEKKGFKTMDDVNKHMKSRREEKYKDKDISKKEEAILDYDWLDA